MPEHGPENQTPASLREDIQIKDFSEPRRGQFVRVYRLADLPLSVQKKWHDGAVIKVYDGINDSSNMRHLFGDWQAVDWPLSRRAAILKERFDYVRGLFNSILPDLVVPTEYFISDSFEGPTIYEIQPEIHYIGCLDLFIKNAQVLDRFPREKCIVILEQLKKILSLLTALRSNQSNFPDVVSLGNLSLTTKGEWRLLDTNMLWDLSIPHDQTVTKNIHMIIDASVRVIEDVVEIISKYLEKRRS